MNFGAFSTRGKIDFQSDPCGNRPCGNGVEWFYTDCSKSAGIGAVRRRRNSARMDKIALDGHSEAGQSAHRQ